MEEQRGNGLLWTLVGCGALLFVGLCVAMGVGAYLFVRDGAPGLNDRPAVGPQPQPTPVQPMPQVPSPQTGPSFVRVADVTQVTGTLSGRVNGTCQVVVEQSQGNLNCRATITCDSILVYGGGSAGYFPGRIDVARQSVSGADTATTANDNDGAMTIDTDARTLEIRDDSTGSLGEFTLRATLR